MQFCSEVFIITPSASFVKRNFDKSVISQRLIIYLQLQKFREKRDYLPLFFICSNSSFTFVSPLLLVSLSELLLLLSLLLVEFVFFSLSYTASVVLFFYWCCICLFFQVTFIAFPISLF